jgi:hypothetical protein
MAFLWSKLLILAMSVIFVGGQRTFLVQIWDILSPKQPGNSVLTIQVSKFTTKSTQILQNVMDSDTPGGKNESINSLHSSIQNVS